MSKFDWILFDADHTLFDFDRSSRQSLQKVLESFGERWVPEYFEAYYAINKQCWADMESGRINRAMLRKVRFSKFFEAVGITGIDPVQCNDEYLGNLPHFPYFMDGATELLDVLHGDYRLGIITNGMKEVQRPRLHASGVVDLFDVIVVSGEIGMVKPNAGFFQHAFDQMEEPDKHRVLVVGDSLNADIRGGRDFGFQTCWYNPEGIASTNGITPDHVLLRLGDLPELL